MIKYPKMINEVIEAIEMNFSDYPSVKIDCMLYLLNALTRKEDIATIRLWFQDNNICEHCGSYLVPYHWKEYHTETDCYEVCTIYICCSCFNFNGGWK